MPPISATLFRPNVRESKTCLDSRFHSRDSGFNSMDSGFQVWCCIPVFVSGTWILNLSGIRDSEFLELYSGFHSPRFRIPQEKVFSDSGFYKPKVLIFRNPDSLSRGELLKDLRSSFKVISAIVIQVYLGGVSFLAHYYNVDVCIGFSSVKIRRGDSDIVI